MAWNAERFFQWRKWKDYGSGVAGDLFVHLFSGTHFITGFPWSDACDGDRSGCGSGRMGAMRMMFCWRCSITPKAST